MERIMAQETIVFTQGGELPADLLTQAQAMKPPEFTLHVLPADASAEDIAAAMQQAEYLMGFVRFLPDTAYAQASRLRLVQVLSAGYDRVNIAGARAARIPICSNGGANSVAVAEHTIMLILAVYRKLVTFHPNVAAGRWHRGIARTVDILELEGKTVGLVGMGNVGQQVARRLQGFDVTIIYYDPIRRSPEEEERLNGRYVSPGGAAGTGRCGELAYATQRRHATHDRCQGSDTDAGQGDSDQYVSR